MDSYRPSGGLDISTFPSEVWMPLLAYLELDDVFKLLLCGSKRTNRRICQSIRFASVKYRGGARIVWPSLLSSFSALESIALLPSATNTFFNLDMTALDTLPTTLKSLQVKIDASLQRASSAELDFPESVARSLAQQCTHLQTLELAVLGDSVAEQLVSSLSQMSSLTSLALPKLTSEHVERLPLSLLHLKLATFSVLSSKQPTNFPNSLQTFELAQTTTVKVVSSLPPSLLKLCITSDINTLLKDCSVLPQSLTHLEIESSSHTVSLLGTASSNLALPPALRHLSLNCYLGPSEVRQLPKTLETLRFVHPKTSSITWSDMPPNLTECPMLTPKLTSYSSLPRKLKRFAGWNKTISNFAVDSSDAGLADLPQSLEELLITLHPDSRPRTDASYSYRHITLPSSLTKLGIRTTSEVESHCGIDFIEVVNGSLPNLKHLTWLSNLPINVLSGLKVSLDYLKVIERRQGISDLIEFREKSASGYEITSLASPSMPLLPWCASLKALEYRSMIAFRASWMKTLPSTLESLILWESDSNVPLPHSSIILSLPPRITSLIMRVAAILPGDVAKLPRTLVHLLFTCEFFKASYPPEDLLSLPRGLLTLTISRNPISSVEDIALNVKRSPHLKWSLTN